uniref:Uncharacterized protein n=1 Tax=Leptocylindrus danicus TaxID=163516 RepID=A0A7S2KTI6_9STRA|mmetsp:Transcript_26471/g.39316  ORF Transcript_26471/g.39316 Transcript_26471/m.39316 type:complete len:172 (+) Transcript_26471:623-1138(+)
MPIYKPNAEELKRLRVENAELKRRVAYLEVENLALRREKVAAAARQFCEEDVRPGISNWHSIVEKQETSCSFCEPFVCRSCVARISLLPGIVSILAQNSFIRIQELGRLACASRALQDFIFGDYNASSSSDTRIWAPVLLSHYPCVAYIPPEVFSRRRYRWWLYTYSILVY